LAKSHPRSSTVEITSYVISDQRPTRWPTDATDRFLESLDAVDHQLPSPRVRPLGFLIESPDEVAITKARGLQGPGLLACQAAQKALVASEEPRGECLFPGKLVQ